MPFLLQGQSVDLTVPQGQSVAVGAWRNAVANVLVPVNAWRGGPWQTVTNTNTVIGPLVVGATVRIFAASGTVEYVQGAAPQVSDSVGLTVYASGDVTGATDSAALQAAVNAAGLGDGVVKLASGTFYLSSTVQICTGPVVTQGGHTAIRGTVIRGSGAETTLINLLPGVRGLWWHSAENLASPNSSTQPNSVDFGGLSDCSVFGAGISQGNTGIQLGGRRTNTSDVMQYFKFQNVIISNCDSCMVLDDVTNLDLDGLYLGVFKYGIEFGYNCDGIIWRNGYFGHQKSSLWDVVTTISNGSATFTVPQATAAELAPGWLIVSPGFPAGTYVNTVNPLTGVITAANYAGTAVTATAGATRVSFMIGRVLNYGRRAAGAAGTLYPQYGSPFVSPFWSQSNAATAGRTSANNHRVLDIQGGRVEVFADIGGPSHTNLVFDGVYTERLAQGWWIGDAASGSHPQNIVITNGFFGIVYNNALAYNYLVGPYVDVRGTTGNLTLTFTNNATDSFGTDATQRTWVSLPQFGSNMSLTYERNTLYVQGSGLNVNAFSGNFILDNMQSYFLGSSKPGDAVQAFGNVAAVQNWNHYGHDGVSMTLTGNATLNNPGDGPYKAAGKVFTIYATQDATGTRTLALGNKFLSTAGSAIGTIAAGTANQRLMARFAVDAAGNYRAITTPVWV